MNDHIKSLIDTISDDLKKKQSLLAGKGPEERKRALRDILAERLAGINKSDAYHILEILQKRFPHRIHERDFQLSRYQKQLKILLEENAILKSKKAAFPQESTSEHLIQGLVPRLIASLSEKDLNTHKEDYVARMSDSLEKIFIFVQELGDSYAKLLQLLGMPKNDVGLFNILKERIGQKEDPGPKQLEEYLETLKRRVFNLLEIQQETITAGVHKILDDLDPKSLSMVRDKTDIRIGPLSLPHQRDKWTVFEKAFTAIRKTPRNKLYRKYFEDDFKHAILEREKDAKTQE